MKYRVDATDIYATPDMAIVAAVKMSRLKIVDVWVEDGPSKRRFGRAEAGRWFWASTCKKCGGNGLQKDKSPCPRCSGMGHTFGRG